MIQHLYPSSIWSHEYFHNTLSVYGDVFLIFIFVLLISYFASVLFSRYLFRLITESETDFDNLFLSLAKKNFFPLAFFLALYLSLQHLTVSPIIDHTFFTLTIVGATWYFARILQNIIDFFAQKKFDIYEENPQLRATMELFSLFLKFILWGFALLIVLSHFGINITSILAGVGIGSIAIAFAVKGILEDLFSSFSIYLDKPFIIGDLIEVDGEKGIVKRIGIKTTRLKSLATGEEIIYANTDLTKKKIHNFRRMTTRRVSFKIGVVYQTPPAVLKDIPQIISTIISTQEHAKFDRAHLRSFDESAIVFSILYHIDTRDYETYLAVHEAILHQIHDTFGEKNIPFAYPTQTIHLNQSL